MSISAPNGGKRSRSGSESGVAAADEQYRAAMPRWTIGVDTGGTFTDCIARSDDGVVCRAKVPSSGELRARVIGCDGTALELDGLPPVPAGFWMGFEVLLDGGAPVPVTADPQSASRRRIMLASVPGHSAVPGSVARLRCACAAPVLAARIAIARPLHEPLSDVELRVGTTIGTNALLEGRTARVLLVTTAGLEDALLIGDQRRRDIFALAPARRSPVTSLRAGVRERMSACGSVVTPVRLPLRACL